jgi:hypothetical protein
VTTNELVVFVEIPGGSRDKDEYDPWSTRSGSSAS